MSSLNRIILVGVLVDSPESRVTNAGDPFATFKLNVKRFESLEGAQAQTDEFDCVAWRQTAEQIKDYQAGSHVVIEGRILTRSVDDNEGKRKWLTEIDARDIRLIDGVGNSVSAPKKKVSASKKTEAKKDSLEQKPLEKAGDSDFNFDDSPVDSGSVQMPPEFEKDVEEDIPF